MNDLHQPRLTETHLIKKIHPARELRKVVQVTKYRTGKNDVPMVYIKETNQKNNITTIEVDGILDQEAIPVLKKVCEHHLAGGKNIEIDLSGITLITREGRKYLQKIQDKVTITHLPDFVKVDPVKNKGH